MTGSIADSHHLPIDAQIGSVVSEKYQIERILGVGGTAIVTAARHLLLDELVALKFLLSSSIHNPESLMRFSREARATAKLRSEHVVRAFDMGSLPSGTPYLVMEYLQGYDVSSLLLANGSLPIERAVAYVLEACEAIAEAHSLGIIHRDLKPANLFCVQQSDGFESIKVLDFGSSKVDYRPLPTNVRMTLDRSIVGTPLYMSPEQLVGSQDVDERTDIWSLGVSLFEMLTSRPPFDADTILDLIAKTTTQPVPSLRKFRSDVPIALEEAVRTCLAKDRNCRYANARELALALVPFGPQHICGQVERIERKMRTSGMMKLTFSFPPPIEKDELSASQQTTAIWPNSISKRRSRNGTKLVQGAGGLALAGLVVAAVTLGSNPFAKEPHNRTPLPTTFCDTARLLASPDTAIGSCPRLRSICATLKDAPKLIKSSALVIPPSLASAEPSKNANLAPKRLTQTKPVSVPTDRNQKD